MGQALETSLHGLLAAMNASGHYPLSLVCAADGLVIAAAGERLRSEAIASLTGLFADIAARAARDLGCSMVDELTVSDAASGRVVVRPLDPAATPRLFLVVQVPRDRAWRRNTATVARQLLQALRPLLGAARETP